ncbi:MAG: hypothetical protein AAF378_24345 [Cyanobacteria bacterium P01_A01_bin.84]
MKYPLLKLTREQTKSLNAQQRIEYVRQSIQQEIELCKDDNSLHPMQIYWATSGNEWGYFDWLSEN